ncbi:MAG: ATP-binding protein [Clostridia bacterium]|nr:ATP-binding protein [Clostridia bacterium]
MLCQFSIKNYKSIRDEITLDMQAASISEHWESVIVDKDEQRFLPVSVIYGPNGGGKSNVLGALYTLRAIILRPIYAATANDSFAGRILRIPVTPFLFSEKARNEPTEFEIFFRTNVAEYRYIIHVKKDVVCYESLDRIKYDTGRKSSLFSRDNNIIKLTGEFAKLKISEDLSAELPLLSYLGIAFRKNDVVDDVVSWVEKSIEILNYGNPLREIRMAVASSTDIKDLVIKMIREMDLDIIDYRVEEKDNDIIDIYTKHSVNDYYEELPLNDESQGTIKVFGLLPFVAHSLLNGTALVIDELDAKLHPILLRYFITLFTDKNVNRKGAQLLFTSHDLSTMNNEVFRRDEIWFVAKGNCQNSQLYSLVEFKNDNGESIRKDSKYDKQYLEGKYGADPYLRRIIDWGEIHA